MSREKTRDQTGNSVQNVPEIVSATIDQIIRPDRRRDGWEKLAQGAGAECLGIVENIDGDMEVKLAGDESIGRSPPAYLQSGGLPRFDILHNASEGRVHQPRDRVERP